MEEERCPRSASARSASISNADSKAIARKKWDSVDLSAGSEPSSKRAKMRDPEIVLHSGGKDIHSSEAPMTKEAREQSQLVVQTSTAMGLNLSGRLGTTQAGKPCNKGSLDLNAEACMDDYSTFRDVLRCNRDKGQYSSSSKCKDSCEHIKAPVSNHIDLNFDDAASSADQEPFCPFKRQDRLKTRDVLECGSTTGPLEEKDSLRIWKEMKQNGFLSPSYGGIPVPKQRGKKSKNDILKKKIEQAKKEQVDRFTKMAAPSGLLNGLNPGIINHVRNGKQVRSIIQALVRSERREHGHEGGKEASQTKSGTRETLQRSKGAENFKYFGNKHSSLPHEVASSGLKPAGKHTYDHMSYNSSIISGVSQRDGCGEWCSKEGTFCSRTPYASLIQSNNEDDILALKLSTSATMASENASSLSNEDSVDATCVNILSFKAANVASQWLQLLQQDISDRLAALRRSKKRVSSVIDVELPFLLSKEFSINQENENGPKNDSTVGCSKNTAAELHQSHWTLLFNQMYQTLTEEEQQLESWLEQVNKMQGHCAQGLQYFLRKRPTDLQNFQDLDNRNRLEMDASEQELAIRASAASMYATCAYLASKENVTCC